MFFFFRYTSLRLALYLLTRLTYITGVLVAKRGVPAILKAKTLQPKSSAFARNGDGKGWVFIVKYEDQKTVYCLTTK